jgi:hypothetical protein
MEGALANRKAIALSYPFFNGFNNWTTQDIATAIQAGSVLHGRETEAIVCRRVQLK